MDYYTAIKSSKLGNIEKGYVKTKENKFYCKIGKEEEFEKIIKMIAYQTSQLLKTDIGSYLKETLMNRKNINKISEFYPKEQVKFVRDLMIGSLKN